MIWLKLRYIYIFDDNKAFNMLIDCWIQFVSTEMSWGQHYRRESIENDVPLLGVVNFRRNFSLLRADEGPDDGGSMVHDSS